MSKKSRKRNKKILGLLAAGLGAAALMRGRGSATAANVDSGRGGDSANALARVIANTPVTGPITGTRYPGSNIRKKWVSTNPFASSKWNKLDESEVRPTYVAPSTQRYSNPDLGMGAWDGAKDGGRIGHKSGGRVGCGKAKRGFGRALKKK